jgi:hypothetical protein
MEARIYELQLNQPLFNPNNFKEDFQNYLSAAVIAVPSDFPEFPADHPFSLAKKIKIESAPSLLS